MAAALSRLRRRLGNGFAAFKRRLYAGGRPRSIMRAVHDLDARLYGGRLRPSPHAALLRVVGRRTGREISVPVAVADLGPGEYLVSMLGPNADWVRNVEAAGGEAVLQRSGRSRRIRLEVMSVEASPPILRRYAEVAPGARPHLGLGPDAPLERFAAIASDHPVYHIRTLASAPPDTSLDREAVPDLERDG